MPDPATPGPGACRDLRAGLPGSELRMRSSPGSRLVVQPFRASKPGFSPAFPPFPACNHRNQISKSDAMLRLAGLRLPRTANGHRVPALKHPLRRIELRSARSALDWRNGVAIWRFGAANRRGRARSRLPVARNDPDKDGNHPDEFTITRKPPPDRKTQKSGCPNPASRLVGRGRRTNGQKRPCPANLHRQVEPKPAKPEPNRLRFLS
jgi:hypothetical protein